MHLISHLALALFAGRTFASARGTGYTEPDLSISESGVSSLITCNTQSLGSKAGGIVLLVHGTGTSGVESWAMGPYFTVLPRTGRGYDVCYINLPGRSMGDAQVTAEYVVAATRHLAPKSSTGKVSLIGHSQGAGLNIPWALEWWPSIHSLVSVFVALAGDLHGTELARYGNPISPCPPSVHQQGSGSNFIKAQNYAGHGSFATALVPMMSIFTRDDEIVIPQGPPNSRSTSYLPGASNFALQDVCGSTHWADHFTIIIDSAAFGLAKLALETAGAPASTADFDKSYCSAIKEYIGGTFSGIPRNLRSGFGGLGIGSKSSKRDGFNFGDFGSDFGFGQGIGFGTEPKLKPYVCARGFAPPGYSCA